MQYKGMYTRETKGEQRVTIRYILRRLKSKEMKKEPYLKHGVIAFTWAKINTNLKVGDTVSATI